MLPFPDIDPVIVKLGPLAVSWYSLSYVTGILIGWAYATKLVKTNRLGISPKNIEDFIAWVIIGIILGGRFGYVLIYDPAKYFASPIEILKTYEGGMSFHGGILGYIFVAYVFSKKYHISFIALTDISAVVTPIAIALGRTANFINSELYGRVTDVPWAVIFPGSDLQPRHPSQLYEAALEGVVLFFILFYAAKHKALGKRGLTSGLFLIFYSIFRSIVELFREPDVHIGFIKYGLTMGQLLCVPMLLLGIYLILQAREDADRLKY
jgi:phosphatidylglycerol:prolipoprotein diacylglycerol transferase